MGSWWSGVKNKDLPVKDDEESQPTTTKPWNQNDPIEIELGILNQKHEESDINRRTEPRTEIDTINNELGTPKQLHKESDINRWKIMGSWWSGVKNKYLPVKDDEDSQQTKTKPRNQNDPINIELEILNQKHEERDINRSNTDGQEYLMKQKDLKILALEEQVKKLTAERESLLIRLSQICCVKLSDGNPNITDLSDPNRADKLVGRFSELYDNQWTDSFQALCESKSILEENAIRDLLQIVLKVYKICGEYTECQNQELVKAVQSFTGVKVGDQVEEPIVQESMHNLQIFRAKNYALKMADVKAEIGKSLQSSVDPEVYKICQDYITECTEVCWLMCVKSPPMYISADKTDTFQHHLYTGYTTSGKYVSYVVWPTLFQYKNGPIMQRGVAQGTNNKI